MRLNILFQQMCCIIFILLILITVGVYLCIIILIINISCAHLLLFYVFFSVSTFQY